MRRKNQKKKKKKVDKKKQQQRLSLCLSVSIRDSDPRLPRISNSRERCQLLVLVLTSSRQLALHIPLSSHAILNHAAIVNCEFNIHEQVILHFTALFWPSLVRYSRLSETSRE